MIDHSPSAGRVLLTTCVIAFVCFFGSYMRIPIAPLFAISLGADTVQVGLINSAFMIMAGGLSIPTGLLSDRIGRRRPLLTGLVLLSGSSFLLAVSQSPLQMGCIYLLFGIGLAALSPTLMSYVADITPPEALGQAFGGYTMALYSGMTLGPAIGGLPRRPDRFASHLCLLGSPQLGSPHFVDVRCRLLPAARPIGQGTEKPRSNRPPRHLERPAA